MEGQNRRGLMREDAGIVELELCQLREIAGGICQIPIIVNGQLVLSPSIPETHPRIL
jgi:hypothetical protein